MSDNELWELMEKTAKRYGIEIKDSTPEKAGIYLELDGELINTKDLTGEELFNILFRMEE